MNRLNKNSFTWLEEIVNARSPAMAMGPLADKIFDVIKAGARLDPLLNEAVHRITDDVSPELRAQYYSMHQALLALAAARQEVEHA